MTEAKVDDRETWKGPQPPWLICMKFGQRAHLEDFRQGHLFTRPLEIFAAMENDGVRHDPYEGATRIVQPQDLAHLTVKSSDGTEIVIHSDDLSGPLRLSVGAEVNCNIFCMFSITEPAADFCDERNFRFGDSFVLVLNTSEFIRRVSRAANKLGFYFDAAMVEYFNENAYSGRTGPFRKPDDLAYQHEFRLMIQPRASNPYILNVGELMDITSPVHPLAEINRICDFGPQSLQLASHSTISER